MFEYTKHIKCSVAHPNDINRKQNIFVWETPRALLESAKILKQIDFFFLLIILTPFSQFNKKKIIVY